MTMTDPIADMLTRLRNANSAYLDRVVMPHSKLKTHIAEILEREGYIAGWRGEPAPRAQHRGGPARLEARAAGVREGRRAAARPRRARRRNHLDIRRPADRQASSQAWSGRGSPRL